MGTSWVLELENLVSFFLEWWCSGSSLLSRAHICYENALGICHNFILPCQMQESRFSVCLMWQSGKLLENTKYDLPKVMTLRNVSSERLPAGTRNSSSPLLNSPYQSLVSAGSLQVSHYQLQPSAFSFLSRILAFKFALCLPFFSWSKRSHWFSAVQPFPAMRNDLFQTPSLLGLKLKANFSSQSSKLLYFL